jgi:hypothetical protein
VILYRREQKLGSALYFTKTPHSVYKKSRRKKTSGSVDPFQSCPVYEPRKESTNMSALSPAELREARLRAFERSNVEEDEASSADDSSSTGGRNSSLSSSLTGGGGAAAPGQPDDTDGGSELSLDFESLSVNSEASSDLESAGAARAPLPPALRFAAPPPGPQLPAASARAAGSTAAATKAAVAASVAAAVAAAAAPRPAARLPAGGLISAALRRSAPPTRQPDPSAASLVGSGLASAPLGRRKARRRDNEARLSALAGLPPSFLLSGGTGGGGARGGGGVGVWRQQQALCLAVFPIPE